MSGAGNDRINLIARLDWGADKAAKYGSGRGQEEMRR